MKFNKIRYLPIGKGRRVVKAPRPLFFASTDSIKDNKREADSLPYKLYIVIQRRGGYYPPAFYYSLASIANVAIHGLIFVGTNRLKLTRKP